MRRTRLLTHVRRALGGAGAPAAGESLVVGLSGGPDSVALLDSLVALREQFDLRIVAAHLDHGLRVESAGEAAFCARLVRPARRAPGLGARGPWPPAAGSRVRGLEALGAPGAPRLPEARGEPSMAAAWWPWATPATTRPRRCCCACCAGPGAPAWAPCARGRGGLLPPPARGLARRRARAPLRPGPGVAATTPATTTRVSCATACATSCFPVMESRFNRQARAALARTAALLADEERLLESRAPAACAGRPRTSTEAGWTCDWPLRRAPLPILRTRPEAGPAPRRRPARGEGRAPRAPGAADPRAAPSGPAGRAARGPGGQLPVRPAPRRAGPRRRRPFSAQLPVPGQVELPDGRQLLASAGRCARARARRRGGRRVGAAGRAHAPGRATGCWHAARSLKRLLAEARVPAELRDGWPVVAQGDAVVWVPGLGEAAVPGVRLELRPASREAR